MIRRVLPLIALFTLVGTGTGCAYGPRSLPAPPTSRPDVPFVFVYETSGFVLAADDYGGVLVAVWPDGRVIRASSRHECGRSYVRTMLSPAQLNYVCRAIVHSGVPHSKPDAPLVVDAATEQVSVRRGRRFYRWIHCPGFTGTNNADSTNPQLTAAVDALMALPLNDPQPEPADRWRGRFPAEWEE